MSDKKKGIHAGHRNRMRDRIACAGIESLPDHEVLEYLLFHCIPYKDTNALAHALINEFGSFYSVLNASVSDLVERGHVTRNAAMLIASVPGLAHVYTRSAISEKRASFKDAEDVGQYVATLFNGKKVECFYVLYLDKQRNLVGKVLNSKGTIDGTLVYVREIIRDAIMFNAKYVILAHNHPSGDVSASNDDVSTTVRIAKAVKIFDIDVLDHLIVGRGEYFSFHAKGIMNVVKSGL